MSNSVNLSVHLKKTFWHLEVIFTFCSFDGVRFPRFPVCWVCFWYVALPSMWLLCGSHFWMWLMIDPPFKWFQWDECSTFETTNLWFQNGTPVSRDFHMSSAFTSYTPSSEETEAVLLPHGGGTKTKQFPTQILSCYKQLHFWEMWAESK